MIETGSDRPAETAPAPAGASEAAPAPRQRVGISCSRNFADWLRARQASIAFSSYQSGRLYLVGLRPNGSISFHQRAFDRAMGLAAFPGRLYLATLWQIWRLENGLGEGESRDGFDRIYVPRNAQTTGDLDIHEIGVEPGGRIVFINTRYSCLATVSLRRSFKPLWQPPFISRLAPEDRCHLNGLAMVDGKPRFATAVCRSDVVDGWRDRRAVGGIIIDMADDRVVTERLSMPHSPRLYQGRLWVVNSGDGFLGWVDQATGKFEPLAFLPGFARGLAFHGPYALVTLSLPRDQSFAGLGLDANLAARDAEPRCGVHIIDIRNGDVVAWLRLTGPIRELFDVRVIPNVRCPMAVGLGSPEIRESITIEAAGA